MITESVFNISLDQAQKILRDIKLFKGIGPKGLGNYSAEFKKVSQSNKHIEIYKSIRDNLDYEIILEDDSFFQFSRSEDYLRYSFIENPNFNYSKFDFLQNVYPDDESIVQCTQDEVDELVDENEYEQFLNEQEINSNLVYLRYDYDMKGYKPLIHSCSHIHVGLKESLRIPSSLVLTPLQFVLFSIKQTYHDKWKIYHDSLIDNDKIINYLKAAKNHCASVDNNKWIDIEKHEIYIT